MKVQRFACGLLTLIMVLSLSVPLAGAQQKEKTNLNNANFSQLNGLPGIGPVLAERILEFRRKNGPFKRKEDLMTIPGIGEKKFLKLKDLVTVSRAEKKYAKTP